MNDEPVDEYIHCPDCGWFGELDECGVSGADEGTVFCEGCTAEIPTEGHLFVPASGPCETQGRLF